MARRLGRMLWMLLDFQCVTAVPRSAISHFCCKRISVSNNFAVLDRADKLDNVIFGMRQELKGELPWQKVVPHIISMISLLIVIYIFFNSGAWPERTKNWVPRPVIQLQKSNTQIPCCRTHIQNKGNAVTDRKHKQGFSKPVQAMHEHSWSLQYECQRELGNFVKEWERRWYSWHEMSADRLWEQFPNRRRWENSMEWYFCYLSCEGVSIHRSRYNKLLLGIF